MIGAKLFVIKLSCTNHGKQQHHMVLVDRMATKNNIKKLKINQKYNLFLVSEDPLDETVHSILHFLIYQ